MNWLYIINLIMALGVFVFGMDYAYLTSKQSFIPHHAGRGSLWLPDWG